jgi:hypothetical protein
MSVLALDLASQTGWALYANGMERPFFGSLRVKRPTGSPGEAGVRLWAFLAERHEMHEFTDVCFEAQHMATGIDPQTVFLLIGLGFMVEVFCHEHGIRVFQCDIGTWRKHFLGKGSFKAKVTEGGRKISSRDQAKQRAIDVCASYGWSVPDDNAADACGILDYYLSILPATAKLEMPWRDARFMAGARLG